MKKKIFKLLSFLTAGIIMAAVFTGCGEKDSEKNSESKEIEGTAWTFEDEDLTYAFYEDGVMAMTNGVDAVLADYTWDAKEGAGEVALDTDSYSISINSDGNLVVEGEDGEDYEMVSAGKAPDIDELVVEEDYEDEYSDDEYSEDEYYEDEIVEDEYSEEDSDDSYTTLTYNTWIYSTEIYVFHDDNTVEVYDQEDPYTAIGEGTFTWDSDFDEGSISIGELNASLYFEGDKLVFDEGEDGASYYLDMYNE